MARWHIHCVCRSFCQWREPEGEEKPGHWKRSTGRGGEGGGSGKEVGAGSRSSEEKRRPVQGVHVCWEETPQPTQDAGKGGGKKYCFF